MHGLTLTSIIYKLSPTYLPPLSINIYWFPNKKNRGGGLRIPLGNISLGRGNTKRSKEGDKKSKGVKTRIRGKGGGYFTTGRREDS